MSGPGSQIRQAPNDFALRLAALLQTQRFGRVHRHVPSLGSTNDEALDWLGQKGPARAPHGALVTADTQASGRGRLGRSWDSSTCGEDIFATLALRTSAQGAGLGALALALGLGLVEALEATWPQLGSYALKWPNDVLLDGRKVAGILCEARWTQQEVAVAAGFGINVSRREFSDPALAKRASSLALAAQAQGQSLGESPRVRTLVCVLARIEERINAYLDQGFRAISGPYRARCCDLGAIVRLTSQGPDGAAAGTEYLAVDLDQDGALLVRRPPSTRLWRVHGGEVWLVPS